MNREPKPATDEHQPWCQAITSERGVGPFPCDCKSASETRRGESGEWTAERLKKSIEWAGLVGASDEINAALAAARITQAHDDRKHWEARVYGLEQQLAAEKKKADENFKSFEEMEKKHAAALWQIEMDTECIERIRNHGMRLEVDLESAKQEINRLTGQLASVAVEHAKQLAAEKERGREAGK